MKKILSVLVVILLLAVSAMAAGKSNHIDLVSKDSADWNIIDGPWGKINYGENFVFNGHELPIGDEYVLLTYGGWSNINCLGEGVVNSGGNIHIKGITPELLSDDSSVPAKIWLVPSQAANCDTDRMLQWTPDKFLFEE